MKGRVADHQRKVTSRNVLRISFATWHLRAVALTATFACQDRTMTTTGSSTVAGGWVAVAQEALP